MKCRYCPNHAEAPRYICRTCAGEIHALLAEGERDDPWIRVMTALVWLAVGALATLAIW